MGVSCLGFGAQGAASSYSLNSVGEAFGKDHPYNIYIYPSC